MSLNNRYCGLKALQEEDMESYIRRMSKSLAEVEGVLHHTTMPNLKALENLWELKETLQEATAGASPCRTPRRIRDADSLRPRPCARLLSLRCQHQCRQEAQPGVRAGQVAASAAVCGLLGTRVHRHRPHLQEDLQEQQRSGEAAVATPTDSVLSPLVS